MKTEIYTSENITAHNKLALAQAIKARAAVLPLFARYASAEQLALLQGELPASFWLSSTMDQLRMNNKPSWKENIVRKILKDLPKSIADCEKPRPDNEPLAEEDELDTFGEWHERTRDGVTTWEPRY